MIQPLIVWLLSLSSELYSYYNNYIVFFAVNYGVLLLRALLEHWPEASELPSHEDDSNENRSNESIGKQLRA